MLSADSRAKRAPQLLEVKLIIDSRHHVIHAEPVRRDLANIKVNVRIFGDEEGRTSEQLWARDLGHGEVEVCCVSLYANQLALGDVVAVRQGDGWLVDHVSRPSGRRVVTVQFVGFGEARSELLAALSARGTLMEHDGLRSAIDAADDVDAVAVRTLLTPASSRRQLALLH